MSPLEGYCDEENWFSNSSITVFLYAPAVIHWVAAIIPIGFDWLSAPTAELAFVGALTYTAMRVWW